MALAQRYPHFKFEVTARASQSKARTGLYHTPHGTIETPNFIFCGTKAAVKSLSAVQVKAEGADIILSNTYHLMISPGPDVIQQMGGLHKFMNWQGPMFTDSGGFQIFSLGHGSVADEIKGRGNRYRDKSILKITEEGARFKSYLDGSIFHLTPEKSIEIQRKLGADLIVQLDECTPFHVDKEYTHKSSEMSMRWGDRSLAEFDRGNDGTQALYGIVQGGVYEDLRIESAAYTKDRPFFATAVGGSLGSTKAEMYAVVAHTMKYVHPDRPVHLLGIGDFDDVFENVQHGIDTFDCVSPTRMARHGWALMKGEPKGRLNLRNKRFQTDPEPIDASCHCFTCRNHSRAYLHHLFRVNELAGMQLVSLHNVATMTRLFRDVRAAIQGDHLAKTRSEWIV
jgi:queuine tRNA-ribosyltransferase